MANHSHALAGRRRPGDRASSPAAAVAEPDWRLMAGICAGHGFPTGHGGR